MIDKSPRNNLINNKKKKNKNYQQIDNQINQHNQILISPFDLKQQMPFCYANYSMINNQSNWMNSDEESSKKISESMVSQIITVDCGMSTTTTQVASSTASSCSLPPNEICEGSSDKPYYVPDNYGFESNLPIKQSIKCKSLLNVIDIHQQPNHLKSSYKKSSISTLAPLTFEWTNLSCEISTEKCFLSNMFNCFINERSNIYNSESSSLNDLNRDGDYHQLGKIFKNKKKGKRLILDKQSGQFKSGTINAIIGASGAVSKSTLLECISGRRINGVQGSVNVYSNTEIFGKNVTLAYLGQVESLIDVLTVKEVLLFASRLKNYKKLHSYEQHLKLVNSIINEFKLECCANNYVHSISGGQLKRVAIASEIIWGPDIIVLDEPTSGLDSCTAYTCIKLLRKITSLVDHQQHYRAPIVICSIHQPSIQLLNEFHNLYVLSNNGRCIYQGPPQNMVKYLAKFNLKCPKYYDPINWVTELASGYHGFDVIHYLAEQERILQEQRAIELQDSLFVEKNIGSNSFKNYNSHRTNAIYDVVENGYKPIRPDQFADSGMRWNNKKKFKINQMNQYYDHQTPEIKIIKISSIINQMKSQSFPFLYHTLILTKRTYFGTIREPKLTWLRIFQALFIGFLMSFLYDHPIGGDQGGCWSESKAIKELLNPIHNLNAKNFDNNVRMMMNLTMINLENNKTELRRLLKRESDEQETKINEFLIQNKLNHQLNSKATTGDNVAFVFFVTLFLVMSSMMPTVLTFPSEVRVLQAEKNNGYYSCGPYYFAKCIADTPFVIFNAILFCSIVYPLTGQLLELKIFILFTFVAIVAALIAHCIGMLFGTIYVHSITSAVFMAPLSMSPVFLFSGFFGKISSLPLFLKPVAYVSYVRYCFECFLIALYGFDRCKITHNRTFFLHRSLHNWTLFQREKDLFFGWSKNVIETTNLPTLPSNPQALIQNDSYTESLIPNSSKLILDSSISNNLFKNISSYVIDKNLLNRFQASFLQKNNNSINLPNLTDLLTSTTNNVRIDNLIYNLSSNLVANTFASTMTTPVSTISHIISPTSPNDTLKPIIDDEKFSSSNLTLKDNNFINMNVTSISPINTFEFSNKHDFNERLFSNLTNSLVLEFYSINDEVFWKNIIILVLIFLFLRILAYIILIKKTNRLK